MIKDHLDSLETILEKMLDELIQEKETNNK